MSQTKSTKDLGCKFENVWELQRSCYTEFDENEDAEKLSYLSRKLAELQKSNAIFKDSVIDFINLLQRGFGNINIAHHNNVLKVILDIPMPSANVLNAPKLQTLYSRAMREKISNLILICFLS